MGTNWTDNLFPLWISSAGVLPEMTGGRHDSSRLLSIPDCVQDQQEPHYCVLETGTGETSQEVDKTMIWQNTDEEKCLVFLGLICRININDLCQEDFNILTRRHHISTRYLLSTVQCYKILQNITKPTRHSIYVFIYYSYNFISFRLIFSYFSDCVTV